MPTGTDWFRDSYRFENGFRRTTLSRIELATLRSYDLVGNIFPEIANLHRTSEIRDIDQLIAACKVFLQADGFWEEFAFCFDAICSFARLYFCLFRERQKSVQGLPDGWDPDLFDDAAKRRNNARRRRENQDRQPPSEPNWDAYRSSMVQDHGEQADESPNNASLPVVKAPSVVLKRRVLRPVEGVFIIDPEEVINFRYDATRYSPDARLFLENGVVSAHPTSTIHRTIRRMRKKQVPMDIESWHDFMHEEDPDVEVKTNSVVVDGMEIQDEETTESIDLLGSHIFGSDYRGRFIPENLEDYPHLKTFLPPQPQRTKTGPSQQHKFANSNIDVSRDAAQDARSPANSTQPKRRNVFPLPIDYPTIDVAVIAKRSDRSSFSKRKLKQSSWRRSAKYLERSRKFAWLRRYRAQNVLK